MPIVEPPTASPMSLVPVSAPPASSGGPIATPPSTRAPEGKAGKGATMNSKKTSKSPALAVKTQAPKAKKTKSLKTGKTKSPKAKKTKSPKAKKTKSPKTKKTKSPKAKSTKGPKAEKSKSPKSKSNEISENLGKSKSKFTISKSSVSGPFDSTAPEKSVEQASAMYDGATTSSNAPSTTCWFLGLATATWICVPIVASLL